MPCKVCHTAMENQSQRSYYPCRGFGPSLDVSFMHMQEVKKQHNREVYSGCPHPVPDSVVSTVSIAAVSEVPDR